MRRERISRPRLSVPRRYPGSAPLRQKGGEKESSRSCSRGSCGARSGAASATTARSSSTATPNNTRVLPKPMCRRGSAMADAGIEKHVGHVDDEVERDEQHGKGE